MIDLLDERKKEPIVITKKYVENDLKCAFTGFAAMTI